MNKQVFVLIGAGLSLAILLLVVFASDSGLASPITKTTLATPTVNSQKTDSQATANTPDASTGQDTSASSSQPACCAGHISSKDGACCAADTGSNGACCAGKSSAEGNTCGSTAKEPGSGHSCGSR